MESVLSTSEQRSIYFATKAVHLYKKFKQKYARATNFINAYLDCDDTFPPMVRVTSKIGWLSYKKLVEHLDAWMRKDGKRSSNSQKYLTLV